VVPRLLLPLPTDQPYLLGLQTSALERIVSPTADDLNLSCVHLRKVISAFPPSLRDVWVNSLGCDRERGGYRQVRSARGADGGTLRP
jgi:hypothetical protein